MTNSPKARQPKHYDTPLPHTIPAHLPLPGKSPDWPFINIGKWKIDVNSYAASWREACQPGAMSTRFAWATTMRSMAAPSCNGPSRISSTPR